MSHTPAEAPIFPIPARKARLKGPERGWDKPHGCAAPLAHRRIQEIHFGEDVVGGFGPDEGLGVVVVLGDVAV
jgi:hypothetical protein